MARSAVVRVCTARLCAAGVGVVALAAGLGGCAGGQPGDSWEEGGSSVPLATPTGQRSEADGIADGVAPSLGGAPEGSSIPGGGGGGGGGGGDGGKAGADADANANANAGANAAPSDDGDAETLGPMPEGSFLIANQRLLTSADIAEYLPIALEDTEEAAFHTAFLLMGAADDVYSSGPDDPGELSVVAALSAPECAWCASVLDAATTAASANLRVTGGDFTPVGDSFDGGRMVDGSVVVSIPVDEAPTVVWNPDGTFATSTTGGPAALNIELEWRSDMWVVTGVSTT